MDDEFKSIVTYQAYSDGRTSGSVSSGGSGDSSSSDSNHHATTVAEKDDGRSVKEESKTSVNTRDDEPKKKRPIRPRHISGGVIVLSDDDHDDDVDEAASVESKASPFMTKTSQLPLVGAETGSALEQFVVTPYPAVLLLHFIRQNPGAHLVCGKPSAQSCFFFGGGGGDARGVYCMDPYARCLTYFAIVGSRYCWWGGGGGGWRVIWFFSHLLEMAA